MEKRKKIRRQKISRKLPRISVEWICSKCNSVHRISFPVRMRPEKGIKVIWGYRNNVKRLEIDSDLPLSKLNEFLNTLFYEKLHAINYVKITYPENLLKLLKSNEEKGN